MNLKAITERSLITLQGDEVVLFLLEPTNVSVLSREGLRARVNALMAELMGAPDGGAKPEPSGFLNVCAKYFDEYLCDKFCNRVLRLLSIEQLSSRPARALYRRWTFDEPLGFQTRVFAALTGRADASYLAVKFYAPIHLYAQRWLLTGTLSEGDKAAFRSDAYRHVRRFFAELGVYRG